MARGVTQEQVNGAIEQLLLAGERPTIERVRATLGTGSPNTLTRMLDVWWQGLGERLTAQRRSAAIPEAPAAVVDAASALWEAALAEGKAQAEAAVAPERAALAEALATMEATMAKERAAAEAAERARQAAVAAAEGSQAALVISDQRVSDLLRQIAQLEARIQDLTVRGDALDARLHLTLRDAESARGAAAAERSALQAHVRQVEDRSHAEIDRLRQEIKVLKNQTATQAREHSSALRAAEQARRTAETDARRAQHEAATLRGRLDALLEAPPARPGGAAARSRRVAPPKAPAQRPARRTTGRRTP